MPCADGQPQAQVEHGLGSLPTPRDVTDSAISGSATNALVSADVQLPHNTLVVMWPPMQEMWKHEVSHPLLCTWLIACVLPVLYSYATLLQIPQVLHSPHSVPPNRAKKSEANQCPLSAACTRRAMTLYQSCPCRYPKLRVWTGIIWQDTSEST